MAQIKTNLQYGVTGSLQTANIGNNQITNALMADDAIGLAEMASGTDGNVITYDASGNPAVVSTGTSGHFLKSQGAGSVPVFDAAGGGKMGQFLSTTKTDTFGIVSDSAWTSIDGFSVDITPSATSSKIWIWYHLERSNYWNTQNMSTRLRRDSTVIGVGTAAGSRHVVTTGPYKAENNYNMPNTHGFLDSPSSTSAITYDVQILGNGSAQQINYYGSDSDTAFSGRSVSTISVMEILA